MTISRCALAVITERGKKVVEPTISDLDEAEEDFLERHVSELRLQTRVGDARGRFATGSGLLAEIELGVSGSDDQFIEVAKAMVARLAAAMQKVHATSSCVVALVVQASVTGSAHVSLLKLDAEIEAAQLEQTKEGAIKLHVFDDLLPSPGEIQKGFSWPDPRAPESELVVLDKVRHGSATKYFQTAFGIDASPRPKDTEDALVREILDLPSAERAAAIQAVGEGGPADGVVDRIRSSVASFDPGSEELGGQGRMAGFVRPGFSATARATFEADGIEISVPLSKADAIESHPEGTGYVTVIRTSTPLRAVPRR